MHEVCRNIVDRFTDPKMKKDILKTVKGVAADSFKVRANRLMSKPDTILYSFGNPEGRL